jgi:hypothetical protein
MGGEGGKGGQGKGHVQLNDHEEEIVPQIVPRIVPYTYKKVAIFEGRQRKIAIVHFFTVVQFVLQAMYFAVVLFV